MTPDQLKKASYHYCKSLDLNPEEVVNGVPRWVRVSAELTELSLKIEAIKVGLGYK